ncbi:MAG: ribonuclease R, partial [Oligoflexia bacterium]|nr:ribonuclease R [Oligoflexia bacterium]
TSPIRRYCDLKIHRLLKQALKEAKDQDVSEKIKSTFTKELEGQAQFISAREQNSVQAERRIQDIKTARFLKKYVGENLTGFVSSVTAFGLFVTLKAFFVEGLVRFQNMEGFWETDEFQLYAKNKRSGYLIQFGDEVEVLLTASHIKTGQVDLQLLSHKGQPFLGRA